MDVERNLANKLIIGSLINQECFHSPTSSFKHIHNIDHLNDRWQFYTWYEGKEYSYKDVKIKANCISDHLGTDCIVIYTNNKSRARWSLWIYLK